MKRLILKIAFGVLSELIIKYAEIKGKYYADELRTLLEEIKKHERL